MMELSFKTLPIQLQPNIIPNLEVHGKLIEILKMIITCSGQLEFYNHLLMYQGNLLDKRGGIIFLFKPMGRGERLVSDK
jgi:hypothetical protein